MTIHPQKAIRAEGGFMTQYGHKITQTPLVEMLHDVE
jgi:hypothetical protein